jgi:PelA/Pel-15E family pectate lyase
MLRRTAVVVAVAVTAMAMPVMAQATPGQENVGPDLLPASRIAALPAPERAAWMAYVAESARLHAIDTAAMNAELRSAKVTQMIKAPYKAPNFEYFDKNEAWFRSDSALLLADAVLTFQTPSGGWSKRTDMTQPRAPGMSYYSETPDWHYMPTFDNGATTGQMRFFARVFAAHPDNRYAVAYHNGLALLFAAQQPNGCWPQTFPLEGGYHDAITFNDDATVLVLTTLDEAASGRVPFAYPGERQRASASARRGVACLVATQVIVGGKRTVWGQQHDPLSLEVVPARTYEIVGLAGRESVPIMTYLMRLPSPDSHVVNAVHTAAAWFRAHAISGYHYDGASGLRADANGAPIWARLTEMGTDRPIFANRDGIKLYDWNKLTDRRTGYGWFSTEPAEALRTYDSWSLVHPARAP